MDDIIISSNRASKSYRLVDEAKKPAGIAPQAQYVFYAMRELGNWATPEAIGEKAIELGLKTRQPASRIVQYYIPTLNKAGIVEKS